MLLHVMFLAVPDRRSWGSASRYQLGFEWHSLYNYKMSLSDYSFTLLKESVLIMNLFRHVNSYLISVHQRYNNQTKSETLPCSE